METKEQKNKLIELVNSLIALGENSDELNLWSSLFELMDESQRKQLLANLSQEEVKLKKLKG